MSAEGSYRELQHSGLDFTRLLGSPAAQESASPSKEETTSSHQCPDAIAADNDFESFSVVSLDGSVRSLSSSTDENRFAGVRRRDAAEPVEIAETRSSGKVSRGVYSAYISAGGNVLKISLLISTCVFTQILGSGCDFWISYWYTTTNVVHAPWSSRASQGSGPVMVLTVSVLSSFSVTGYKRVSKIVLTIVTIQFLILNLIF